MRIGAIDIGSNSSRLLLTDVVDGQIDELSRESIVTRLGDGVDSSGTLNAPAIARVLEAIKLYARAIEDAGCERVGGVATSAVREAENGDELIAQIADTCGIPVEVIDGDREAELTFVGASTGDAIDAEGRSLVIDIGGGSTELIVGDHGELRFHTSTKLGAVRQSERHLASDPPTAFELEELLRESAHIIGRNVAPPWRIGVTRGIAVAGTPTVLAAIDLELEVFDPWKVHGHAITRDACESMLERLASLPLAERRKVTGLHPDRAPTIVAGATILLAAMRTFDLAEVIVSEHDILYGLALGLARG